MPPATIHRLFSSKLGILSAVLDVSIAGDDQGLTLQGRPEITALLAEPDPRKLLAGFAGINVAINARSTDVYRILVSASGSDPQVAALLTSYTRMRDQGQRIIAATLARAHALQPRMRERDPADIIHALMSPELYRLLVTDRGWSPRRYQKWLTSTLIERLLVRGESVAPQQIRSQGAPEYAGPRQPKWSIISSENCVKGASVLRLVEHIAQHICEWRPARSDKSSGRRGSANFHIAVDVTGARMADRASQPHILLMPTVAWCLSMLSREASALVPGSGETHHQERGMNGSAVSYAAAAAICFALGSALQHQAAAGEHGYRNGIELLWRFVAQPTMGSRDGSSRGRGFCMRRL